VNFKYKDWEKRFREYTEIHDAVIAWHLANRDFGIGRDEYERADESLKLPPYEYSPIG
jgi:hypothetical protein